MPINRYTAAIFCVSLNTLSRYKYNMASAVKAFFSTFVYLLVCVVFEPTHVISSFSGSDWLKPGRRHLGRGKVA